MKKFSVVASLFLVLLLGCGNSTLRMSSPTEIKFFYNTGGFAKEREEGSAIITFKKILVYPLGEKVGIKIFFNYKNTGLKKITWGYGNACLKDAKGRIFEGARQFSFQKPNFKAGYDLTTAEPGLSCESFVCFELPKISFDSDVFFGFISRIDKDAFQGNIMIFERSTSNFDFKSEKEFTTESWK